MWTPSASGKDKVTIELLRHGPGGGSQQSQGYKAFDELRYPIAYYPSCTQPCRLIWASPVDRNSPETGIPFVAKRVADVLGRRTAPRSVVDLAASELYA